MNPKTRDNLIGVFIILLFVLAFVFMYWGMEDKDEKAKIRCQSNCARYYLPFLKSEGISSTGYVCFCLDTDGKPRQVPSE